MQNKTQKSLLKYLSMNNHVSLNSAVKASFVLRMDNSVHWIKLYPVDSAVYFVNTYMDSFLITMYLQGNILYLLKNWAQNRT